MRERIREEMLRIPPYPHATRKGQDSSFAGGSAPDESYNDEENQEFNDESDHRVEATADDDDDCVVDSPSTEIYREVFGAYEDKNGSDVDEPCTTRLKQRLGHFEIIAYISCFALFGTVVRVFLGRLLGFDCEDKNSPSPIKDFMSPLSNHICITASGKTVATGGALFTDLPANMLGSFFAGLLTPSITTGHNIAWFRADHPLQQNKVFQAALRIGFCGSLTTFSSWNTQMVVMMDGTATVLGSQVPAALFGYMIGIMCPIASFFFGRHVYEWWITIHSDVEPESELILPHATSTTGNNDDLASTINKTQPTTTGRRLPGFRARCFGLFERLMSAVVYTVTPFLLAALLVGIFVYAGHAEDIAFYRKMWLSAVLAPFGAVFRWWLIQFNDSKGFWKSFEFIPWGTLAANLIGCIVSILAEVLNTKYFILDEVSNTRHGSLLPVLLPAIAAGFSGSLSTVSTFVTELVVMKSTARSYIYGAGTVVTAMVISLVLYCPIIRS
jgi:CrcB protein